LSDEELDSGDEFSMSIKKSKHDSLD